MKFEFPDGRMLNGKRWTSHRTPLFDGPFLKAEVGSEKLKMTPRENDADPRFPEVTIDGVEAMRQHRTRPVDVVVAGLAVWMSSAGR